MVNYDKMSNAESEKWREAEQFRKLAFLGVLCSTVAILTCMVTVPMLYNYVQRVQTELEEEMHFCKSRTGSLWQVIAYNPHF